MWPSVRKRIQNYEYKIYKYKYLFIKRKEATTNYKIKKKNPANINNITGFRKIT